MVFSRIPMSLAVLVPAADMKVVEYTFRASYFQLDPDHTGLSWVQGVNEMLPGPEVRVQRYDRLRVNVINDLQTEELSLHWHGFEQRGSQEYDGAMGITQCGIKPKENFVYDFVVDEEPGTYMWHEHAHMEHVAARGFFGAVIVEEPEGVNRLWQYDRDVVVTLNDYWGEAQKKLQIKKDAYYTRPNTQSPLGNDVGLLEFHNILINGKGVFNAFDRHATSKEGWLNSNTHVRDLFQVVPQAGETLRLRVMNAGALYAMRFRIDGHQLRVIQTDGGDVEDFLTDAITLSSGERFDVLVTFDRRAGSYWIRVETLEGNGVHHGQLGVVRYNGTAEGVEPTMGFPRAHRIGDSPDLVTLGCVDQAPISATCRPITDLRRHPYFKYPHIGKNGDKVRQAEVNLRGFRGQNPGHFTRLIDGKNEIGAHQFDGEYVQFHVPHVPYSHTAGGHHGEHANTLKMDLQHGETVRIVLQWQDRVAHPWHLHGHKFAVLGVFEPNFDSDCDLLYCRAELNPWLNRDGLPALLDPDVAPVKDTVHVPAGGWAVIQFKADNPGWWFFHCHMLIHVHDGMGVVFLEAMDSIPKHLTNETYYDEKGFPSCKKEIEHVKQHGHGLSCPCWQDPEMMIDNMPLNSYKCSEIYLCDTLTELDGPPGRTKGSRMRAAGRQWRLIMAAIETCLILCLLYLKARVRTNLKNHAYDLQDASELLDMSELQKGFLEFQLSIQKSVEARRRTSSEACQASQTPQQIAMNLGRRASLFVGLSASRPSHIADGVRNSQSHAPRFSQASSVRNSQSQAPRVSQVTSISSRASKLLGLSASRQTDTEGSVLSISRDRAENAAGTVPPHTVGRRSSVQFVGPTLLRQGSKDSTSKDTLSSAESRRPKSAPCSIEMNGKHESPFTAVLPINHFPNASDGIRQSSKDTADRTDNSSKSTTHEDAQPFRSAGDLSYKPDKITCEEKTKTENVDESFRSCDEGPSQLVNRCRSGSKDNRASRETVEHAVELQGRRLSNISNAVIKVSRDDAKFHHFSMPVDFDATVHSHHVVGSLPAGSVCLLLGQPDEASPWLHFFAGRRQHNFEHQVAGELTFSGASVCTVARRHLRLSRAFVTPRCSLRGNMTVFEALTSALNLVETFEGGLKKQSLFRRALLVKLFKLGEYINERVSSLREDVRLRVQIARQCMLPLGLLILDGPLDNLEQHAAAALIEALAFFCGKTGLSVIFSATAVSGGAGLLVSHVMTLPRGDCPFFGKPTELKEHCRKLHHEVPRNRHVVEWCSELFSQGILSTSSSRRSSLASSAISRSASVTSETRANSAASLTSEFVGTVKRQRDMSIMSDGPRTAMASWQIMQVSSLKRSSTLQQAASFADDLGARFGTRSLDSFRPPRKQKTFVRQCISLLKYELAEALVESVTCYKFLEAFGVGIGAGMVWFQKFSVDTQTALGESVGLLFFSCAMWTVPPVFQALAATPSVVGRVTDEYLGGFYHINAFVVSNAVTNVLTRAIWCAFWQIVAYTLADAGASVSTMLLMHLVLMLNFLAMHGFGLVLGMCCPSVLLNTVVGNIFAQMCMLTNGFYTKLPSWLQPITVISIPRYTLRALLKLEYRWQDSFAVHPSRGVQSFGYPTKYIPAEITNFFQLMASREMAVMKSPHDSSVLPELACLFGIWMLCLLIFSVTLLWRVRSTEDPQQGRSGSDGLLHDDVGQIHESCEGHEAASSTGISKDNVKRILVRSAVNEKESGGSEGSDSSDGS